MRRGTFRVKEDFKLVDDVVKAVRRVVVEEARGDARLLKMDEVTKAVIVLCSDGRWFGMDADQGRDECRWFQWLLPAGDAMEI